jgi:hypothetical protein
MKSLFKRRGAALTLKLISALGLAMPGAAFATDWNVGAVHPTVIESTYFPGRITFQIDQSPSSSCPAGAWLTWFAKGSDQPSQIANAQAALTVLMTAKASGKTVRLFGNNSDCSVDFMWLTD